MRPCRVVCSTSDTRWHAERGRLVTGTKAMELGCGLLMAEDHPFRTGKPRPYKDGDADPRALWFGQQKEPMVGAALRLFGRLPIRPFSYLVESTAIPGLGASFDFLARWPTDPGRALALTTSFPWMRWPTACGELPRPGELVAVEVKCRSIDPGWRRSWEFRHPKKAAWQGQAQMAVLGVRFVLWAVHIDHAEIHLALQAEDDEMRAALAEVAGRTVGRPISEEGL